MERFSCYQLGCHFWMQQFGQGLSLGTAVTQTLVLTSACKPLGLGISWRDPCEILAAPEHQPVCAERGERDEAIPTGKCPMSLQSASPVLQSLSPRVPPPFLDMY